MRNLISEYRPTHVYALCVVGVRAGVCASVPHSLDTVDANSVLKLSRCACSSQPHIVLTFSGPEGEERDVVHMMSDKDSGVVRASIYQAGTGTSAQEERKAGCQEALSRRGARQGVRPLSPLNN